MRCLGQLGVQTFLFDFAGSGLSQGEFVSLGYHESSDTECAINYVRSTGKASEIILWGRSMGAAAATIYASRDVNICILQFILAYDKSFSTRQSFSKP